MAGGTKSRRSAAEADPTRAKLIEAAGEVFAESGFQAATVREICQRAGANVAAVNYHFGDKLGLYTEVLRESVCANQALVVEEALAQAKTPEQALRMIVSGMLHRMYDAGRPAWNVRMLAHEMAQPTPALKKVIRDVMRPRYEQLRGIIGQILGLSPDHKAARLAAHSVIGQVVHYVHARPIISVVWPELDLNREADLQMVADHIADFTLRSLEAKRKERGK